ncbi:MAG: HEAT repeat domain-containing protein [Elusimicrobiota bacterium]|nr:MAG: HEAT repeat domain-containing protein [Elusimicrobiota bacterium]
MKTLSFTLAVSLMLSVLPAEAVAQVARSATSSVHSVPAIGSPLRTSAPAPLLNSVLPAGTLGVAVDNPSPLSLSAPAPILIPSAVPSALNVAAAVPAAAKPSNIPQAAVPAALKPLPFSESSVPTSDAPQARALPDASALFDGSRAAPSIADKDGDNPTPVRIPRLHPVGQRFTSRLARWTGAAAVYSLYRDGVLVQRYVARLTDRGSPPARRAAAARLLGSLGRVETIPTLGWAHENDPSPRVRRAALASLLHVARAAEPKLVRTLATSPRSGSRQAAATTLSWLVSRAGFPRPSKPSARPRPWTPRRTSASPRSPLSRTR